MKNGKYAQVYGYLLKRSLFRQCLCLIMCCFFCFRLSAEDSGYITITGKVKDDNGVALSGVSVTVKGKNSGTITGQQGEYSISVQNDEVLVFSLVGYESQEISVAGKSVVDVTLLQSASSLGEVVVTALGIRKSSKSITYAMQKISSEELKIVPQSNFINELSGKAAGVTINSSAAGVGASAKVVIRGSKSIQGYNQPLYVIDGVPLVNAASESLGSGTYQARAGSDGISNLNSDDIESMSILKGAAAAALYGSAAANGVVLITMKKGKTGAANVSLFSSYTADKVAYLPELQSSYGVTSPGAWESWGAPINGSSDNISTFLRTGSTFVNGVSISGGTEKSQSYFSYANMKANGIMPNNDLIRHNFNFHQNLKYFKDRFTIDFNTSYTNQTINNAPSLGVQNALTSLYLFPRGEDFEQYKTSTVYDPVRKLNVQNWYLANNAIMNPYWWMNNMHYKDTRNRIISRLALKLDIAQGLNLQVRGNIDKSYDINTARLDAGGHFAMTGSNGHFSYNQINSTLLYGDALLTFNKSFNKVKLNAVAGTSISDSRSEGMGAGSTALYIPNVFTIQNMDVTSGTTYMQSNPDARSQLQALFGDVNLSFDDWLFFNVTGRNDWASTLSYTPNGSYFYPSVGLSAVLNEVIELPGVISLAKIRTSYATVGNSVPLYVTNPINSIGIGGNIIFNTTAPFNDLKPEMTKALELGADIGLFSNQFNINFTYYKANSTNQFFPVSVPPGTGYSVRYINAGDVQNTGVELTLDYTPITKNAALNWSTIVNFSTNKNTIKSLAEGVERFYLASDNNFFYSILEEGGSFGDIYGLQLKRDEATGRIIIGTDGRAVPETGAPVKLGNPNPEFQLGWMNTFSYGDFALKMLVDGKFGGIVVSQTQMLLDGTGVSKISGEARDKGGVTVNGMLADGTPVNTVDANRWYQGNYNNKVNGEYVYDATVVKLREVSLGYSLPNSFIRNSFIKSVRLSLIGRNLIYFYRPAPYDPDITFSTGNGFNGVDAMNLPATRSYGLSFNLGF